MKRQNELVLGELSARFRLINKLGSGGFGDVYEAYDAERESSVALKTLTEFNPGHLIRFKREFRSLTDLAHPNLVTLYEMHHHRDMWFFTMELLRGQDFMSALRYQSPKEGAGFTQDGPQTQTAECEDSLDLFDTQERLALRRTGEQRILSAAPVVTDHKRLRSSLLQLAQGITALHDARQLHRDIKPSNIIITPAGRVVLLDFGLICELNQDGGEHGFSRIRTPIHFVGTPHYMAPEQALGREVTVASDWYSVGVLLYQALTGVRPVEGRTPLQILMKKQSIDPRPILELNPHAPEDLAELAMRLLERDPEERPRQDEILTVLRQDPAHFTMPTVLGGSRRVGVFGHSAPFVGRSGELNVLKWAFSQLRTEKRGALMTIESPSGLGKTALTKRFLRHVRKHDDLPLLILEGRCYENDALPYKALDPVIDQLVSYLELLPAEEIRPLLTFEMHALVKIFPVLLRVEAIESQAQESQRQLKSEPDAPFLRQWAFDALRTLFQRLCARYTTVLVLENVQWADEDSAIFLEYILAGVDSPQPLVLISMRREDEGASVFVRRLRSFMRQGGHHLQSYELELEALSDEESGQLATALLSQTLHKAPLTHIVSESRGNPFFIEEMVRHFAANPGARDRRGLSLEQVLFERVQQLPLAARQLLEVICISGQPISEQRARQIAQLQGKEQDALFLLRNAHCVQVSTTRHGRLLEPYHDRIRAAVLSRMSSQQAVMLHFAFAQGMAQEPGQDPEVIAHHYVLAQRPHEAAPFVQKAAEAAVESLAFEHAAKLYQDMLGLLDWSDASRAHLHELIARYHGYMGRGKEAGAHFLEASTIVDDVRQQRRFRLHAANQFLRVGLHTQGLELLDELLDEAGIGRPRKPAAMMVKILAMRARLQLRGLTFGPPTPLSDEASWRLELCWGAAQTVSCFDVRMGAYLGLSHLLESLQCGEPLHLSCSLSTEAIYLSGTARTRDKGYALLERAAELVPQSVDPNYNRGLIFFAHGMALYLQGLWSQAFDQWSQGLVLMERDCVGMVWESEGMRLYQFAALEQRGQLGSFYEELSRRLELARQRQDEHYSMAYELWGHLGALAQDQPELITLSLDRIRPRLELLPSFCLHHYWFMNAQVNMLLYRGQARQAWDVLMREWVPLKRSLLLQTLDVAHATSLDMKARCALALIRQEPSFSKEGFKEVDRCIRALERLSLEPARAHALALRAQQARYEGEGGWRELWSQAISSYERADMGLRALALRVSLYEGVAPERSAPLRMLHSEMLGRGVLNPERWVLFYVPSPQSSPSAQALSAARES